MPWDDIKPRRFKAFDKDLDGISRQTMEDHYKLYEGYVKKVNECRKIFDEFNYSEIEGNQVYSPLRATSVDYTFALLGYKNHDLYFGHLGGEGGEPTGRFAELVESEFHGGLEQWHVEIYFEHFRGSFGDKWMWTPVALSPALTIAGLAGVRSERAARTWLPALSALYCLDGVIGTITHIRGVARKPGGFQEPLFNIVMGPPLLAPGSLALVGGMGLAAAAFGRER